MAYCRWFEQSDVDVVNLQEVWTNSLLRFIRDRLPSFAHVAWRPGIAGQPAGGLATFSRVPLSAVSFTSFAGVSPRTGSPQFRILKAINSRLQGVLTMELAGRQIVVGNTHLSANRDGDWSEGNRHFGFQRAQLQALQQAMQKASFLGTKKAVLCGDFNISSSGPLTLLSSMGADGWIRSGQPITPLFTAGEGSTSCWFPAIPTA